MAVKSSELQALLLAAGQGKRLGMLPANIPKPLIEIAKGHSVLEYTLRSMSQAHLFDKVVVVTGYKHSAIRGLLEKLAAEVNFKLEHVVNHQYANRSVLYSVEVGLAAIRKGDILVMNGDTVFSPAIFGTVKKIMQAKGFPLAGVIGSMKSTPVDDDIKLQLDDSRRILHVGKNLQSASAVSAGIVLVSDGLRIQYESRLRELKDMRGVIHHSIIEALCADGAPISFIEVPLRDWFEVDTVDDVRVLRRRFGNSKQIAERT